MADNNNNNPNLFDHILAELNSENSTLCQLQRSYRGQWPSVVCISKYFFGKCIQQTLQKEQNLSGLKRLKILPVFLYFYFYILYYYNINHIKTTL